MDSDDDTAGPGSMENESHSSPQGDKNEDIETASKQSDPSQSNDIGPESQKLAVDSCHEGVRAAPVESEPCTSGLPLQSVCAHCSVNLSSDSYIASYDLKGSSTLSVLQGLLLIFKGQAVEECSQSLSTTQSQLNKSHLKFCSSCGDQFQTVLHLYLDFVQSASEDSFVHKLINSKDFGSKERATADDHDDHEPEFEGHLNLECLLKTEFEDEDEGSVDVNDRNSNATNSSTPRTRRRRSKRNAKKALKKIYTFGEDTDEDEATEIQEAFQQDSDSESPRPRKRPRLKGKLKKKVKAKAKVEGERKRGRPRKDPLEKKTPQTFSCGTCSETFSSKTRLRLHEAEHNGSRPFSCEQCSRNFINNTSLLRHKRKTHSIDTGKKYARPKGLKRKKREPSGADAELLKYENYKCEDCAEGCIWFETFKDWVAHQEGLHGEVMGYGNLETEEKLVPWDGYFRPCPHCGKKYKSNFRMVSHIKLSHLHLNQFQCQQCGKSLSTKATLQQHLDNVHGDANKGRKYLCSLCGADFNSKGGLEVHERTHLDFIGEEKQFGCELCEKKFARRHRLKMHMTSAHSEARNFVCDLCGSAFKLSGHLKQHKKYMHVKKGIVDQFCSFCGKGYAFKDDLKYHLMATHKLGKEEARIEARMKPPSIFRVLPNGDRVYPEKPTKPKTICPICNRTYVRREQLYLHLISIHNYTELESKTVTGLESKRDLTAGAARKAKGPNLMSI